ncbi:COG4648 family protein [Kangiella sp. M94]
MQHLFKTLIAIVVLLYPLAVYFGLQYLEPKSIALLLGGLVLIRGFVIRGKLLQAFKGLWIIVLIAGLCIASLSFFLNTTSGLKLYPAIITASFLAVFAYSLYSPPSVIERIARTQEPELPAEAIPYTKNVTKIWCAFFIVNIFISLYTTFFTTIEVWTLYNGLISYLLMGLLFFGELIYRKLIHQSK